MPTLNCQNRAISAGVRRDLTPQLNMAGNFTRLTVILEDPTGVWPAQPDETRHLTRWGLMADLNDGAGYVWVLYQDDLPFGSHAKDGSMPAIEVVTSEIFDRSGQRLRVSILADANTNLGATATVT